MVQYWPSTHTIETWNFFINSDPKAEGYSANKRKKVEKMQPGDIILFYIKGEKKFAGCAEITGGYFHSKCERFIGDIYPCCIQIEMKKKLPPEKWVSMSSLINDLNLPHNYPNKGGWGLFFRTEPNPFDMSDGKKILEKIENMDNENNLLD